MKHNMLLATDVYKLGHLVQYLQGTNKVESYLMARSNKNFSELVFFGLQYYLKEYLSKPLTVEMAEKFFRVHKYVLGPISNDVRCKILALAKLGYWPVEIKSVEEGSAMPVRNALMTIESTHPDFYWCVGYIESILLKVWYTTTVATTSYHYRKMLSEFWNKTSDLPNEFQKFYVHDFGYRGDTSEEGACISGVAHLLSFIGSDTLVAFEPAEDYYYANPEGLMSSVPASEHSVMCSYGRDNEIAAFERMLELYPSGIVSIVSDTFNVWNVLTNFVDKLKDKILARNGKTVFRPDSGNPEFIICGNPNAEEGSLEWKGCIRLLDEKFGHSVNSKGYKVLNPKVGLIYGDGMYLERYKRTLTRLEEMGYSADNLVIGVGGILRNHSRDTLGFALKATQIEVNGIPQEIEKDPITDPGKKSHKGVVCLTYEDGQYKTVDQCTPEFKRWNCILKTKFKDGKLYNECNFADMRKRIENSIRS